MKKILVTAVALCFLAGVQAAFAQEKVHIETKVKEKGPGPNVKVKKEVTIGTVKEYEAGRKIKVVGPGDKTYTFDLDKNARVIGTVAPGKMATVEWVKDNHGKEQVTVITGSGSTKGAAEMAAPAPNETMASKSKTTVNQPGPDVKMKTETVIGTVKEFERGKKIKVTGPGGKDYTFDLDKGVGMKGKVAVGSRVKVEYTKTNDGSQHVTVVSLVSGRKTKKAA
ncbi:MAG TPA: hypothetical protein VGS98_10610 [Thermoanaerobaculia bacterium]|nr:hypothetical protein [Thermoanaerobaculia bacterium]